MTIEAVRFGTGSPVILAYLKTIVLVGVRLSGLFIFAPVFSSTAITGKLKVVLLIVMTLSIVPMVSAGNHAYVDLGILTIARESAIALIFGLSLSMIMELSNTAGQVAGMQFSFTLVNLLDPNSNIETPLFSQVFQLLTTTIIVSSGFDRIMISSMIRLYSSLPVGRETVHLTSILRIIPILGSVLLAAIQLVSPLIMATVLIEISIALLSRLSPQLPVLALTVPAKTIVGFGVLVITLASWTLFIEGHLAVLLDFAQNRLMDAFGG